MPRVPRPEPATLRNLLDSVDGNVSAVARLLRTQRRTVARWCAELRSTDDSVPEEWGESDEQADKRARAALRRRLVELAGAALGRGLAQPDCPTELALETMARLRLLDEPHVEPEQPKPVVIERAEIENAIMVAMTSAS